MDNTSMAMTAPSSLVASITEAVTSTPKRGWGRTRDGDLAIGHLGWAAVIGVVAGWDLWAVRSGKETLSGAYGRSLSHPVGRTLTTAATAYLILHLQGWPRQLSHVDPLNAAGRRLRRKNR